MDADAPDHSPPTSRDHDPRGIRPQPGPATTSDPGTERAAALDRQQVPTGRQRVLAIISLAATGLIVLMSVIFVINRPLLLLAVVVGLGLVAAGGWWLVTERERRRLEGIAALATGLVLVMGCVVTAVATLASAVWRLELLLLLTAVAVVGARGALARDLHELDRIRSALVRPSRPVLICNPRSGNGKVTRLGLAEEAAARGIEVVLLEPGADLAQLTRDAVERGADCLGMAGGDGSQAIVAAIAVEHGLPFVCVSAGTRNHFALDLGLAKDDPRAGLVALVEGVERNVDFATVNGRLFVNNVSLGVYATIIQDEAYRDAKLETTRLKLPQLIGPDAEPFDLQFTTPGGREVDGAFLAMVSNNPYSLSPGMDVAQRRTLDSGKLGVIAITGTSASDAARLVSLMVLGGRGDPNLQLFTTETFEIRSRAGRAAAGIDGEAVELSTPLVFRIHPRGLRVLIPRDRVRAAEERRIRGVQLRALTDIARGRAPTLAG